MVSAPSGTAAASAVLSPSPAAVATAASRRRPLDVFRSMGRSWALINSSSLFRRLALCMAVVGVVSEVHREGSVAEWCGGGGVEDRRGVHGIGNVCKHACV